MKTVFFGFIAVVFFMQMMSCSKEHSLEVNKTPIVIIPDTTYQPLETPSFWIYQDSATSIKDTLTTTDSVMTINSKLYTVLHNSSAGQTADEYFNISSHNYYSYGSFGNGLDTIELLYLNDTASPGYNWQATAGSVNGFPAQVQGQIIDTGLTVTIGSNTFTNVIHTEIDIEYNVGSGFQTPYAIYDYYVAKGVGIIKLEENYPTLGVSSTSFLISYTIQ